MTTTTATYPVHVDAHLDPRVSRGLWLVKWVLAIPHYVILAFLWPAFVVMSVVAFLAILVTGRYPRTVFDFNVGVLRWTWRVGYYAYGALGTDQYPPFTLRERPDYPAHLTVDRPGQLSRGLVLVKWWLLALPHYLVVGILLSGGVTLAGDLDAGQQWVASTGLIGLLVLVAAVMLLFTGRYPQSLFDLVLGLNRWVLRVAAYAALMTDEYPPFRLDQGGHEAGSGCVLTAPPATPTPFGPTPAPTVSSAAWTTARVTALVGATMLILASLGVLVGGVATVWADRSLRDDAGYVMSGGEPFATATYAITSEPFEIYVDRLGLVPESLLGRAKLSATSPDDADLFVGVAPTVDVERYLDGVAHARVSDAGAGPRLTTTDGAAPPVTPDELDMWLASDQGRGTVTATWPVTDGSWTLVTMNSDGARGVDAEVAVGATLPWLDDAAPVLLSVGGTTLVVGLVALALTIRAAGRGATQSGGVR